MHLAPRRARSRLAVFFLVSLARLPEAQTLAVNDRAHSFAAGQPFRQFPAALRDAHFQRGEPVAQMAEAGYRNVQPTVAQ